MNRKHNPMLSLVAVLLLAVILVTVCIGCSGQVDAAETEDRFTVDVWAHRDPETYYMSWYILTDNETGAQYLVVAQSNGVGVTALQNGEE